MKQRYADIPDFFDHDPLLVDLLPLQTGDMADSPIDFVSLVAMLRQFRLQPVAVRGGNRTQTIAAELAGLMVANEATVQRSAAAATPEVQVPAPAQAAGATTENAAPKAVSAPGALVIDKPLRSGQQIYARGRDLVVMAMVNPGAEVIADGHIHVYAPLRGKAIAGARGNTEARIFALAMDPELISIAGIYRTSDTPLPPQVLGHPAQVRLMPGPEGDKLVIDPLNP
jgi:septum site-determining protein MinC